MLFHAFEVAFLTSFHLLLTVVFTFSTAVPTVLFTLFQVLLMYDHNYYYEDMCNFISTKWNEIKTKTAETWNNVKTEVSTKYNEIS